MRHDIGVTDGLGEERPLSGQNETHKTSTNTSTRTTKDFTKLFYFILEISNAIAQ